MKTPSGRGRKLWFWSGVILLSISAFFWGIMVLGIAGNIAINPEFDLTGAIVGGVFITILPIGLGIYCVRRGRKSLVAVVPPVPVPPVSQRGWVPPCDYKNFLGVWCKETDDLAQCPECDGWFCKKHDRHECFPKKLDAQLQKQVDVIRNRRRWARNFVFTWAGLIIAVYGWFDLLRLHMGWGLLWGLYFYFSEIGAAGVGIIIYLHYSRRIRQLGVRKRSIRPQTAKEDR